MLDPPPRVVLVPGLGLFGLGRSAKDAAIAADIAEAAIEAITDAEAIGRFDSIPEADMFDMEYWSLEQAKLGKREGEAAGRPGRGDHRRRRRHRRCHRQGVRGGGRRGRAARSRRRRGAGRRPRQIGGAALAVECDVTDPTSVRAAFDRVVAAFGGVDIAVSNAGAAWQGSIGEVDEAILRKSFELNFFAHQTVAQAAVKIMLAQGTGGCLLFNVSKQAVNPGPNFGPYGLPKAATLFLVRQYALDYGADGIRANAVNADRIRSGILTDDLIAHAPTARGVSREDYMSGNLLGREVTAEDVAQAFLAPGAGAQDHRRRHHRRRRQHRGRAAVNAVSSWNTSWQTALDQEPPHVERGAGNRHMAGSSGSDPKSDSLRDLRCGAYDRATTSGGSPPIRTSSQATICRRGLQRKPAPAPNRGFRRGQPRQHVPQNE